MGLRIGVIYDTLKLIEGVVCGAAGNGTLGHDEVIAAGLYNL